MAGLKSSAFTCTGWHGACTGVTLVTKSVQTGVGVMLWCPSCRVAADLEAVGERVDVHQSKVSR